MTEPVQELEMGAEAESALVLKMGTEAELTQQADSELEAPGQEPGTESGIMSGTDPKNQADVKTRKSMKHRTEWNKTQVTGQGTKARTGKVIT